MVRAFPIIRQKRRESDGAMPTTNSLPHSQPLRERLTMTNNGRWHPYLTVELLRLVEDACADIERLRRAGVPLPNVGLEVLEGGHKKVGSAVGRMMALEWLERYALPLKIRVNQLESERERG